MAIGALDVGSYKVFTASGNIKSGPGAILGIVVASSTAGTVALFDSAATDTNTLMLGTTALVGATYLPVNACFVNGLNIVVGGALNATVIYV